MGYEIVEIKREGLDSWWGILENTSMTMLPKIYDTEEEAEQYGN